MRLPQPKRVTVKEWVTAPVPGVVGLDFETFYTSAYSVSQMGNWAYVHDRRFNAWAVSVSDGERTCVCPPAEFPWGMIAGREWVSHNREFDEAVFLRLGDLGVIPRDARPVRWFCSAALCAFLQLPRDLAGAAKAVFGVDLDKTIRAGMKGRDLSADLPGMIQEETDYAACDAEMALALWNTLSGHWPAHERRLYEQTVAMGRRGLVVDWDYVDANLKELNATVEAVSAALPWKPALSITKFEAACADIGTPPPKSTAANDPDFQDWVRDNMRSDAVIWARHMQRMRSANRTAKVLESMKARRKADGRMVFELKYYGATPGRWSGGGGLNMQNYNRKPAEGVDLRRCIVAPPGCLLAVVDYAQIESRVLLFLAGDTDTLDMFRLNPDADAYEIHARATMGWRPEVSVQGSGFSGEETLRQYCERTGSGLRQLAKARVLGLGFGCGARRFIEVAKVMAGLEISFEESDRIVREFRESNPKIVALWEHLNDACASCDGGDYVLPLPCTQVNSDLGRFLIYRDVAAGENGIECTVAGDRIKVYGGLLAENWTQGTARDVLASAWLRCDASGFRPVLSVHDELVFEVPEASAEEDLRRIVGIFEEPVAWAPGLPLLAEGKLCAVYGK
ncbi:MAG: DNA polymerase [Kiritimatiellaeota bacterium]|nr:DNA polymerase [Kiritimatiellota bacterium]